MDIKLKEKKITHLCDSTRDYTPDPHSLKNLRLEENKFDVLESKETYQRRSRKDMNCAKDRYKTKNHNRDNKTKNMKDLKIRKEDSTSESRKKVMVEEKYDDEKVSQVVDEALKEIYNSDSKNSNPGLKRMKQRIENHVEKNRMPEIILETLINKLSSIMENEKERIIEKHCSDKLIYLLKNNLNKTQHITQNDAAKKGKDLSATDFCVNKPNENNFQNFWKTYKKEIDDVINQLNQLYSILLNSVKEITLVFEYPLKQIEKKREGAKMNIETFIKDKFFDIICNDDLIKTLIQEIKKNQKSKSENTKRESESTKESFCGDFTQTHGSNSTCDDNETNTDENLDTEGDTFESQKSNREVEKENYNRNLNDWVTYINEDQDDEKNSPKKKKANKTSQNKKKKKSKKNSDRQSSERSEKQMDEEEKSLMEFRARLENDSHAAKEKEKIKPFFSKRFLSVISSRLN